MSAPCVGCLRRASGGGQRGGGCRAALLSRRGCGKARWSLWRGPDSDRPPSCYGAPRAPGRGFSGGHARERGPCDVDHPEGVGGAGFVPRLPWSGEGLPCCGSKGSVGALREAGAPLWGLVCPRYGERLHRMPVVPTLAGSTDRVLVVTPAARRVFPLVRVVSRAGAQALSPCYTSARHSMFHTAGSRDVRPQDFGLPSFDGARDANGALSRLPAAAR